MKPSQLTPQDVAAFARLIVEKAEYDELSDAEKQGCAMALEAASPTLQAILAWISRRQSWRI